jgi:hypothetical protein
MSAVGAAQIRSSCVHTLLGKTRANSNTMNKWIKEQIDIQSSNASCSQTLCCNKMSGKLDSCQMVNAFKWIVSNPLNVPGVLTTPKNAQQHHTGG